MQCRLRGPPSGVGLQVWVFGGGTYSHFFADLHVLEWTQPVTPAPEATAQLQMDLLGFWASGRGADVLVRSEDGLVTTLLLIRRVHLPSEPRPLLEQPPAGASRAPANTRLACLRLVPVST